MKKRKAWRYTCDFCKKSGCSGGAISNHEKRCFRNPGRECPMCQASQIPSLLPIMDGITEDNEDEKLKALKEAAEDCPACILSTLMQGPQHTYEVESGFLDSAQTFKHTTRWCSKFDYKKSADDYMNEKRSEENSYYGLRGGF